MDEHEYSARVMQKKWFPVVDDLIGGWAISTVDKPESERTVTNGEDGVANFITEELARYVCGMHNRTLPRVLDVLVLEEAEDPTARFTFDSVPVGHLVPGSGRIIEKTPHAGVGWHITYEREWGMFAGEQWTNFRLGKDPVPVRLTSSGLQY